MKTILLADDSRAIRHIVSGTLRAAGYEVIEAANGLEGVEKAKGQRLNLVLTDFNMPKMDGVGLTRGIRALPEHRTTPILVVTTESQLSKKELAKQAGANGWIVKPIQPPRLVEVVAKVIGKAC